MIAFQVILWVVIIIQMHGPAIEACYATEEHSTTAIACTLPTTAYVASYGPRIEINGAYINVGSCDSGESCTSVDSSKYAFSADVTSSYISVTLTVNGVDRTMTRFQCFLEGASSSAGCDIYVYVKGSAPVCQEPTFIDGGTAAVVTCVSDSIYPSGFCRFAFTGDSQDGLVNPYVTSNNTLVGGNGDQKVECQLHITITGSQPGNYRFVATVTPAVSGVPSSAEVYVDLPVSLDLSVMALFNEIENGHEFDYPSNGEITVQIAVTGNPEPSRISLSSAYEEGAAFSPLPGDAYQATYAPSADNSASGVITLVVSGGLDSTRQTYYTLLADNGVLGSDGFEYTFKVKKADDEDSYGDSEVTLPEDDDGNELNTTMIIIISICVAAVVIVAIVVIACIVSKKCGNAQVDPNHHTNNIENMSGTNHHTNNTKKMSGTRSVSSKNTYDTTDMSSQKERHDYREIPRGSFLPPIDPNQQRVDKSISRNKKAKPHPNIGESSGSGEMDCSQNTYANGRANLTTGCATSKDLTQEPTTKGTDVTCACGVYVASDSSPQDDSVYAEIDNSRVVRHGDEGVYLTPIT